ncbi:hypothetical protein [Nocardia arthritidis]|uniref:Uncharacterized protein n=1 Tax=Nocardia arthritidis TaxID=228602 RepID=A0A6G9YF61_9NOCA|nr:hypothetical protein [Nocardia arthritidis]QIS11633.1 hypothetical protein F5544_18820 [Nocardia arthritidis]
MDIAAHPGGVARPRSAVAALRIDAERAGALTVLLGTVVSLIGLSWDVQWHNDVGPDTFFTLPHLFLYSGSAIAGFASLAMVLRATAAQRADRDITGFRGGVPVRVFGGMFTAPLGYMVAGAGAASFLLYGLLDLAWHSIYGFDAVLNSPPHIALFLSMSITMAGSLIIFASAREQLWGRTGFVLAVPILMTFTPITVLAFAALPLPVDPRTLGTIFFVVLLLILSAGVLRLPYGAVLVAVALGAMQGVLWWFSPWAARVYADWVGLPLRDGLVAHPPSIPSAIPVCLIIAAVVVDGIRWQALRRGWPTRWLPALMGAVGGLVIGVTFPMQHVLLWHLATPSVSRLVTIGVWGIAIGALAGFLGQRIALLLRYDELVALSGKGR